MLNRATYDATMRRSIPSAMPLGGRTAPVRRGAAPATRQFGPVLPNVAVAITFSLRRLAITWVLVLLLLVQAWTGSTQPAQYSEYQVKGAFLVKFAMFVDWPTTSFPDPNTPITIGILGEDPFGGEFEAALKSEVASGRHFELKRFGNLQELTDCHMIFVTAQESQRLPEILGATRGKPVLIVGDRDRFAHEGGMVNFIKESGKVRFEVNAAAIEAHGLKISAKLLQVSRPVTPDGAKGGALR
jgi:hypothetical protein